MKILTITAVVLLLSWSSYAQNKPYSIDVNISGRVDTSNADVKAIYHLFKNYLESRPDSMYNNPYWNEKEKRENLAGNVAVFYTAFYSLGVDPKTIFSIWRPFILSIEKKHETKYLLRIAFMKDSIYPDRILTTLNVNAIKENDKWVLENTFTDIVNSWNTRQYKHIKYVYPKTHVFNNELARESVKFCDSIAPLLQVNKVDTIHFYICDNPDEMGLLFGYEYYYLNYTTGLTFKPKSQIFSAKGNEFYPHEFVHILFNGRKNDNRNYIIEEGLACFFGEYNTPKYKNYIVNLARDYVADKPGFSLDHLLTNSTPWSGYQAAYPTGIVIAELAYDRKGYAGLRALSDANTATPEDIYKAVQTIIKLDKVQFEQEFRKKLIQHQEEAAKK